MTKAELTKELALYKRAFDLATEGTYSYTVEGWGGRYKTKNISEAERRENVLKRAADDK